MPTGASSSRERIARHRANQRERGLRPVVIWLPDTSDPGYRQRLAEECRQLSRLTPDDEALADGIAALAGQNQEWR